MSLSFMHKDDVHYPFKNGAESHLFAQRNFLVIVCVCVWCVWVSVFVSGQYFLTESEKQGQVTSAQRSNLWPSPD